MLKITLNSRTFIVARHWAKTNEVELVDTTTCSVQRVSETSISEALAHTQRIDLTTLPLECGFVSFLLRPRDFIRLNQLRRQEKLLSYRGRKSLYGKATRNADMTSEDSCDEWGQPISKAPKRAKIPRSPGSKKPGAKGSAASRLESKLSSAKQSLAQKGLGDLFD